MSGLLWQLGLLTAYTYRDPERLPLGSASDYIYAPADGKIRSIERLAEEPLFIGGPAYRIEIASSWLTVPIQRTPLPGRVQYIYNGNDGSSRLGLETAEGVRFLVTYGVKGWHWPAPLAEARPVFLRVGAGQLLPASEPLAVRSFGNSLLTTLYLPADTVDLLREVGQPVQAGMTIIGRLKPR